MDAGSASTPEATRGALREEMAPELVATGNADEVAAARRLSRGLAMADLAHGVALVESAQIEPGDGARLLRGLLDLPVDDFPWDPSVGDAFSNRELALAARIGSGPAGWLSAGRPRREAMRVGLRLTARSGVLRWTRSLESLLTAIMAQARTHADAPCADYTYLQVAQPTTVGHWILTFAYPAIRDIERAQRLQETFAASVAGVGGTSGSSWATDRQRLASLLGCERTVPHCRDAMWQVDGYCDLLCALATSAAWMSQLAQDLEVWASAEFGFVRLADRHSRESALMPQKRNPYALVMIRTHAARLAGDLATALTALHTGSARTDHFQVLNGVVPRAIDDSARVTDLFGRIVGAMTIDAARMRAALEDGTALATDVADMLARTTVLDYRAAHTVVGRAARGLADAGQPFANIDTPLLEQYARDVRGEPVSVDPLQLARTLDPVACLARRTQAGSCAPAEMGTMLEQLEARLARRAATRIDAERSIDAALDALVARAEQLASFTVGVGGS